MVSLTCQYGHGSGLAGSIMAKQSSDLTFIHVQIQIIHSFPLSFTIKQLLGINSKHVYILHALPSPPPPIIIKAG